MTIKYERALLLDEWAELEPGHIWIPEKVGPRGQTPAIIQGAVQKAVAGRGWEFSITRNSIATPRYVATVDEPPGGQVGSTATHERADLALLKAYLDALRQSAASMGARAYREPRCPICGGPTDDVADGPCSECWKKAPKRGAEI